MPAYLRDSICLASSGFLSHDDLSRIPHTYVYGEDGEAVADHLGAVRGERLDQLRTAIAAALKR